MKLLELADPMERAGFIPYYFNDEGEPVFYFMMPSKENYGGLEPQIAKGRIDKGENVLDAAVREAKEELGLKRSNLKLETVKLAWRGKIKGTSETYLMSIFIGEIKKKNNFKTPHFETASTYWMTVKDFAKYGKSKHLPIVRAAAKLINQHETEV